MMIASPTTTSAAATTITKKAAIWPSRLPCCLAKATRARLRGVEHQLDAHEHDDRVAAGEHADAADREEDRGEDDVRRDVHCVVTSGRGVLLGRRRGQRPTSRPACGAPPSWRLISSMSSASAGADRTVPRAASTRDTDDGGGGAVGQQRRGVDRVVPGVDARATAAGRGARRVSA